jgi:hypothetical protein
VQVDIDKKENGEQIIMKIQGFVVNTLIEFSPETSENYVIYEVNSKVTIR